MTLDELKLIEFTLEQVSLLDRSLREYQAKALDLLKREIYMKTMDPRKG